MIIGTLWMIAGTLWFASAYIRHREGCSGAVLSIAVGALNIAVGVLYIAGA